jgi:mycothiol synthase
MGQQLPGDYTITHPTPADIPAIIEVMRAFDIAELGEADVYDPDDILRDWEGLDLTRDAWLIHAPGGTLCGYATLTVENDGRIAADGYVHPHYYNHGIGSTIVELTEQRAYEIVAQDTTDRRLVLVNNVLANSEASCRLLESYSYQLVRVFFRMYIDMPANQSSMAQVSSWPEGIVVRTCDGSDADIYRSYEIVEDAFRDHWGHTAHPFEDWRKQQVREGFDPSLWFLAQEGEEVVGAARCKMREEEGWISALGVRRAWRKRGLGAALLQHAFNTFWQRGIPRVGLGVDGQSLTGAQRLYERVGMHVTMRIARYEKELRAGRDVYDIQHS